VHGEQFLIANLLLHQERSLQSLAISAAPCGHCRQFYSELACAVSSTFNLQHQLRQSWPERADLLLPSQQKFSEACST
jgi:cytidine deaminase